MKHPFRWAGARVGSQRGATPLAILSAGLVLLVVGLVVALVIARVT